MSALVEVIKQLPEGLLIAAALVTVVAILMIFWWPRVGRFALEEGMPLRATTRYLYLFLVWAVLLTWIVLLVLGVWQAVAWRLGPA